jgi:hypothetical protein
VTRVLTAEQEAAKAVASAQPEPLRVIIESERETRGREGVLECYPPWSSRGWEKFASDKHSRSHLQNAIEQGVTTFYLPRFYGCSKRIVEATELGAIRGVDDGTERRYRANFDIGGIFIRKKNEGVVVQSGGCPMITISTPSGWLLLHGGRNTLIDLYEVVDDTPSFTSRANIIDAAIAFLISAGIRISDCELHAAFSVPTQSYTQEKGNDQYPILNDKLPSYMATRYPDKPIIVDPGGMNYINFNALIAAHAAQYSFRHVWTGKELIETKGFVHTRLPDRRKELSNLVIRY